MTPMTVAPDVPVLAHRPRRGGRRPSCSGLPAAVSAASTDPDKDGLPSAWEIRWSHTNPKRADTDRDGIKDGREDPDKDTLTNREEYVAGMQPRRADSDRDGIRDDREDTDGDGLRTKFEYLAGTAPGSRTATRTACATIARTRTRTG